MGAIVSAAGIYLSYLWDLPTGATIATTLGAALVLLAALRALIGRRVSAPS
jgi:ABC-type Mn2+/Zn2+ transport system permease subunit